MTEPRRPRHDSTAVADDDNGHFGPPREPQDRHLEHPESDSGESKEGADEVDTE